MRLEFSNFRLAYGVAVVEESSYNSSDEALVAAKVSEQNEFFETTIVQ